MARFDNATSITMLFTGAFLVSLGVIAFLNVEMQSRSEHGTKIRNENIFDVIGRKLSRIISSLRERNSYRRALLYHLLVSENATRTPMRRLQYFAEDSNSVEEMPGGTYHRLRHEKKIRRLTELHPKERTNSSVREVTRHPGNNHAQTDRGSGVSVNSYFNGTANRTVQWAKGNGSAGEGAKDILKEKLAPHQNCYTTNDVLEIIAITCLVNFIFWFIIITSVNVFTRNQKMWKSDSFESLTSIGSGSEYELCQRETKKDTLRRHNVVQDYVDSLKLEAEVEVPGSEASPEKAAGGGWGRKASAERRRARRFVHLPNVLVDLTPLDSGQPPREKVTTWRPGKRAASSLSMEDLIF